MQRQYAVSAYFIIRQILPFGFSDHYSAWFESTCVAACRHWRNRIIIISISIPLHGPFTYMCAH